jgi:3-hydroxypropanoate dehydrogenase
MRLDDDALDLIFRNARSHDAWLDRDVDDAQLHRLVDLMKMGPTTANSQPIRIRFLRSHAAKLRLRPHLIAGNVDKVMTAPVCAILAYDTLFYDRLGELYPSAPDARSWFAGDQAAANVHALRNSSLQGAYFIIAARSLGLDTAPMSGFANAAVDKEFFPGGSVRSNFLCALGHGDAARLPPASPRPQFDDLAEIL